MTTIASLFATIEAQTSIDTQWAALEQAQIAGLASLHTPHHGNSWDTHMWSIDVLGAKASGYGKDEVIRNWMRVAASLMAAESDLPEALSWAVQTIEGPGQITMAEAVDAARLIMDNADRVPEPTADRARGVLTAIATAEGTTFHALRTGQTGAAA